MATDNKTLGRFILDGIPAAPRGIPQIEVSFDIDSNGILEVKAQDKATGRSQHITITASSGLSKEEVERMRKEGELHAEEDSKRKEIIEARNNADNAAYTAEKTLRDGGDKVPADLRKKVEDAVAKLRQTMTQEDAAAIRSDTEALGQLIQQVGASLYQQPGGQPSSGPTGENPQSGPSGPQPDGKGDGGEDVVDGEFKNV
jgi:molecular chaperone DnaK